MEKDYRTTIQMTNSLREQIVALQEPMSAKTLPEVLRKLLAEHEQIKESAVFIGEDNKTRFHNLKNRLGITTDEDAMLFLLELYDSSNVISKELLEFLRKLG